MASTHRTTGTRSGGSLRRRAAVVAVVLGLGGLTACSDSQGPEEDVTLDDLFTLEDQVTELSDRVGQLEEGLLEGGDPAPDQFAPGEYNEFDRAFFQDPAVYLDQEVTVSGAITDVVPTIGQGGAFRIGPKEGVKEIDIISADPLPELSVRDVVRVTGEVKIIERAQFEDDFGVSAVNLFDDPDEFFLAVQTRDQVALAASSVELLDPEPANDLEGEIEGEEAPDVPEEVAGVD